MCKLCASCVLLFVLRFVYNVLYVFCVVMCACVLLLVSFDFVFAVVFFVLSSVCAVLNGVLFRCCFVGLFVRVLFSFRCCVVLASVVVYGLCVLLYMCLLYVVWPCFAVCALCVCVCLHVRFSCAMFVLFCFRCVF